MLGMKQVRNLGLSALSLFWPLLALADRYGIQEAMEGGSGSGSGLKYLLGGAAVGAGIGYAYGLYYNSTHDKKIAADGCMVIGGMLGAFVLPLVYIAATK